VRGILDLDLSPGERLAEMDVEPRRRGRINENYARKPLELHTLGGHVRGVRADTARAAGLT
jgi:uncharacterized protein (DUF1800 family)